MKQIHKYIVAFLLLAIVAVACNKDAPKTEFYEGGSFYYFSLEEIQTLESNPDQVAVVVYFSSTDGTDGTADYSINAGSSTAIADTDFSITNASSQLQFNSDNGFSDTIFIDIIDNEEFTGETIEIVLDLENTQNGNAGFIGPAANKSSIKILIQDDDCPTRNIAGDYNTTTTGTSTDVCCPDATTVTGEVSIIELSEGEYQIFDWSAGLYATWYEIYGITATAVEAGALNAQLSVLCDDVASEFAEPFGTANIIIGKVDLNSGIITYTWRNGFDDTATVTLTPK